MDELVIEEKKYVSSKRAAKMTGYAKDYIGQLCREGRVPARFVGRNWYVLESAIQDHRFGPEETDIKPSGSSKTKEVEKTDIMPPIWESPRYEAISADVLPTINQIQTIDTEEDQDKQEEKTGATSNLDESWQAWFNNFDTKTAEPAVMEVADEPNKQEELATEQEAEPQEEQEIEIERDVSVPIHTVYQLPPEELLPRRQFTGSQGEEETQERQTIRPASKAFKILKIAGTLLAIVSLAIAVLGSGYLDRYIISSSQVRIIAGVGLYNK